jgi:hypothetical protein
MGVYVDCRIKIMKGDPKEVFDVIRPKDGVIDLSTVAEGEGHKKFWSVLVPAEYEAERVSFCVKNCTPDAIFDDLAKRFPTHEFKVEREFDDPEYPITVLLFKDGEFQKGFTTMDGKTVWREIPKLSKNLVVKRDSQTRITAEHVNKMLSGRTVTSVEAGTTDGWIVLNLAPLPDSNPDIDREFVTVYLGSTKKQDGLFDYDVCLHAKSKSGNYMCPRPAPRIVEWAFDDSEEDTTENFEEAPTPQPAKEEVPPTTSGLER